MADCPMPYLLALVSAGVLGVADFLGGVATRRTGAFAVVVVLQSTALLALLALVPLLPAGIPTWTDAAWSAGAGVAGTVGIGFLYHGLATGSMSVVAPVTAVVSASLPVVVGMLLGERPTALQLAGVLLALVAIALVSREEPLPGAPVAGAPAPPAHEAGRSAPAVAVAAGLGIGAFYVLISRPSAAAGIWPLVLSRATSLPLLLALGMATRRRLRPRREALPVAVTGAALDAVGTVFYLLAVQRGPLSLVAVLTSLYPASTVMLAVAVLGERPHAGRVLGLGCAALAVALIVGG